MTDTTTETETETPVEEPQTETNEQKASEETTSRFKRFAAKVRETAAKAIDRVKKTLVGLWNKFTHPTDDVVISSTTSASVARVFVFSYLLFFALAGQFWFSALIFGAWVVWEAWNLTHVSSIFTRYLAFVNSTRTTTTGTWFKREGNVA